MAISLIGRERLRELVRELDELVVEEKKYSGRSFTFAELEDDSIEVTDLLAQMLMEERLSKQFSEPQPALLSAGTVAHPRDQPIPWLRCSF